MAATNLFSNQRAHVLIVDDDGDVVEAMAEMLVSCDYRVSIARDGVSMREFLATSDPVDAVILDALMPGERTASLALHAKALRLPVVVCSGSFDAIVFAEHQRLQMLRKPFRRQELVNALTDAMSSGVYGHRNA